MFCYGIALYCLLTAIVGMAADQPESLREADRAFNAGDYARAESGYQRALSRAHGRWACELRNSLAAVAMARSDLERFQQLFAEVKACKAEQSIAQKASSDNLLVDGGFEDGLNWPWGSGHYEDSAGKTAFGAWWNSMNARAFMKLDADVRHSGDYALRVTNFSPSAPHVFTTTAQRIDGLRPNSVYRISLYAKAEDLTPGAVVFSVDAAWAKRLLGLPPGTYGWRSFSATVNIGHNDYIDLRLIHQNTGTVWLDDIVVEPAGTPKDTAEQLQQAESLGTGASLPRPWSSIRRSPMPSLASAGCCCRCARIPGACASHSGVTTTRYATSSGSPSRASAMLRDC